VVDATTTLNNIEESLKGHFGSKEFDVNGMLKDLAKRETDCQGQLQKYTFIIDLECQFDLASGKGKAAIFELKNTYIDILDAKMPYLMEKWIRKLRMSKIELNFEAITKFVLREARIVEEISKYTWGPMTLESTSQSEDRDSRDVSTPVRSISDSGLEEEASGEDTDSAMDASLPVTGQRTTCMTCGCPLCGDAHLLMRCRKFLRKVPIQRWRLCKREKLCLRCLGRNHFSKHCYHMSCSDCGRAHHSLLHGVKRTPSS
jgi:hypothetical protein